MRRAFFSLGSPPSDAYSLGSMEAGGGTVYAYLHRGEIAEWREIANFQEIFRKMLGWLASDRLFSVDMASSGCRALHATWPLCNRAGSSVARRKQERRCRRVWKRT